MKLPWLAILVPALAAADTPCDPFKLEDEGDRRFARADYAGALRAYAEGVACDAEVAPRQIDLAKVFVAACTARDAKVARTFFARLRHIEQHQLAPLCSDVEFLPERPDRIAISKIIYPHVPRFSRCLPDGTKQRVTLRGAVDASGSIVGASTEVPCITAELARIVLPPSKRGGTFEMTWSIAAGIQPGTPDMSKRQKMIDAADRMTRADAVRQLAETLHWFPMQRDIAVRATTLACEVGAVMDAKLLFAKIEPRERAPVAAACRKRKIELP